MMPALIEILPSTAWQCNHQIIRTAIRCGEGLELLENWWGASFANLIHQTGFGEPGKGAPHGDEDTRFAAHT